MVDHLFINKKNFLVCTNFVNKYGYYKFLSVNLQNTYYNNIYITHF
jgi:hypothetical protein